MQRYKIFVDGSAGTTGLRILDRLAGRPELELISLPEADRKNLDARAEACAKADLVFLCLPDAASREIVPLIRPMSACWTPPPPIAPPPAGVYGLPELAGQRARIVEAARVAVPGCHATGFAVLAAPLVQMGLLPPDYPFTVTSLTGYSGGGKSMIADYRADGRPAALDSPRSYGLGLHHKHLPEMQAVCGLAAPPAFVPVVADYYCGMQTILPLHMALAKAPARGACPRAGRLLRRAKPDHRAPAGRGTGKRVPGLQRSGRQRPAGDLLHRQPGRQPRCCWPPCLTTWAKALPARRSSA